MVVDQSKNRSVKMGMQLEGFVKENLKAFLKVNTNVTAYNAIKMPGVELNTMVHRLNVRKDLKSFKKKKHPFVLNRQEAI